MVVDVIVVMEKGWKGWGVGIGGRTYLACADVLQVCNVEVDNLKETACSLANTI